LEYLDPKPLSCIVNAVNRSYQGIDIRRQLQCSVRDDIPCFEITDDCIVQPSMVVQEDYCSERQVVTFHLGDGVMVSQLSVAPEAELAIYQLTHPATQRTIQLHLPNIGQEAVFQMQQRETFSGLQFMQTIATTVLQLSCPIGTEVKWKIHVR
jgi:hypothetical protein